VCQYLLLLFEIPWQKNGEKYSLCKFFVPVFSNCPSEFSTWLGWGFFNTNEPNIRLFNKDTDLKRKDIKIPYFELKITEWIPENKMTDEQKKYDKDFHVKEGTLIKRTYKEAWALYWNEAKKEDKQLFLDLPNFDSEIFEEITGINVEKKNTCNGKIVEIASQYESIKLQANGTEWWIK